MRTRGSQGDPATRAQFWQDGFISVASDLAGAAFTSASSLQPRTSCQVRTTAAHLLLNQEPLRPSRKNSANAPIIRNSTHRTSNWCFTCSRFNFDSSQNLAVRARDVEVVVYSCRQNFGRKSRCLCFIKILTLSILICRHAHFKQYPTFLKTSCDLSDT